MVKIIQGLKVRGAPLIGVAAALSIAQLEEKGASKDGIEKAAVSEENKNLLPSTLRSCVDRVLAALHNDEDLLVKIEEIFLEDVATLLKRWAATHRAELLNAVEIFLTRE